MLEAERVSSVFLVPTQWQAVCEDPSVAERDLSSLLGDVSVMRARYLEWSVRLARAGVLRELERRPAAEADLAAALRIAHS